MNFIYCRRVYMAYKKEKSKRKLSKLLLPTRIINTWYYYVQLIFAQQQTTGKLHVFFVRDISNCQVYNF